MSKYVKFDHPWIDDSRAPIYIARVPNTISDEELSAFLEHQDKRIQQFNHPFAHIMVLGKITGMSPKQRAMWAEADLKGREIDKKWNCGQAFVIASAIQRATIRFVYFVQPPVYPYTVVETMNEAVGWAIKKLRERGVEITLNELRGAG